MEIVKILELTGKGFNADQIKELNDYKIEDVSALIEAGKSTDEVMALLPIMDKNATTVTPEVKENPPVEDKPTVNTDVEALTKEIQQLKATIQADNLKKASIPNGSAKPETADDVIKGFFEHKDKN